MPRRLPAGGGGGGGSGPGWPNRELVSQIDILQRQAVVCTGQTLLGYKLSLSGRRRLFKYSTATLRLQCLHGALRCCPNSPFAGAVCLPHSAALQHAAPGCAGNANPCQRAA